MRKATAVRARGKKIADQAISVSAKELYRAIVNVECFSRACVILQRSSRNNMKRSTTQIENY